MGRISRIRRTFLEVFRYPQDIHRVISALFLSVTFSHIYFIAVELPVLVEIGENEIVLISLISAALVFQVLWSFFSSDLNIKLYIRQFVVIGWGILAHRLGYGVETLGSKFVTIMLLTGWSIWIPFALTGMRFDELQHKIEVWQNEKRAKNRLNADYIPPRVKPPSSGSTIEFTN